MKKFLVIILTIFTMHLLYSQESFNLEDYQNFLRSNENMSVEQLLEVHDAGKFKSSIRSEWDNALYSDSVDIKYGLTDGEKSLIKKNGFTVSERLSLGSFGHQFEDIYHKDFPVYISSDAILHAFHASYDKILKNTELSILIDRVSTLIENLKSSLPQLEEKYLNELGLNKMLHDLDVYLTVPQVLLTETGQPHFVGNTQLIDSLITEIEKYEFITRKLFSTTPRKIDFSQFKPRGHYEDEYRPELARYFKTMMWFGKIELYLIAPKALVKVPIKDVQRQIIISYLFDEAINLSNSQAIVDEIEKIIETFVGEQDNVTIPDLEETFAAGGILDVAQLLDTLEVKNFQEVLKTKSFSGQKILSQVLISDPFSPDKIEPASAFMPFGQRFVIDSYITANVVYDKTNKKRMLPSTLDILFALGNDGAAQLLKEELEFYEYSSNLAALRYLIDGYDFEFWNNSIYNLWLNSIRELNPPKDRVELPQFMQTAAWWQQKMNSQLSTWTELRHDNLLYAKQSYTGGATCSYPYSYVEPVPKFYGAVSILAEKTQLKLELIESFDEYTKQSLSNYFNLLKGVADTLGSISQKELDFIEFTSEEKSFLKRLLYNNPEQMCGGPEHLGWYPSLFYEDWEQGEFHKEDYLVADYHTAPTDAGGSFVGWVKHAGTGKVDLLILNTKLADGSEVAFVGPVSSYHEYTSTNFYRITDSEWQDRFLNESTRPEWSNIYLADSKGNIKTDGVSLITGLEDQKELNPVLPETHVIAQNYPNPFNPSTKISFNIPSRLANSKVVITVFDVLGNQVKELLRENLTSGNYIIEWNGQNDFNKKVATGIYFYEIRVPAERFVGKMSLIK